MKTDNIENNAGWPNKTGDYLAAGRPILANRLENINKYIEKYSNAFIVVENNEESIKSIIKYMVKKLEIKTPSFAQKVAKLSGGNQQKIVISKWLVKKSKVLILDQPTRGIDVGAKFEIYQLMINLANKDKGVVMISSEMPELLGVTDRILVMSNGRVAGIVNTKETSQEEILKLTAKYL